MNNRMKKHTATRRITWFQEAYMDIQEETLFFHSNIHLNMGPKKYKYYLNWDKIS